MTRQACDIMQGTLNTPFLSYMAPDGTLWHQVAPPFLDGEQRRPSLTACSHACSTDTPLDTVVSLPFTNTVTLSGGAL